MPFKFNPTTGKLDLVNKSADLSGYLKLNQTTPQTTVGRFNFRDLAIDDNLVYTDSVNNRVGIGKTTPTVKLDIDGQVKIDASGSVRHETLELYNEGSLRHNILNYVLATNGGFGFKNSFQSKISHGTLASPTSMLANEQLYSIISAPYYSGGYKFTGSLDFLTGPTFGIGDYSQVFRIMLASTGQTSRTEKFRIDSTGNVGIGTTSPQEKLDVNGAVNATGFKINGADIGGFSWTDFATRWTSTPVLYATEATYKVYKYTYGMTNYYRKVLNTYDPTEDKFFSDTALATLIASRALTI
jgi:hypothetical protein